MSKANKSFRSKYDDLKLEATYRIFNNKFPDRLLFLQNALDTIDDVQSSAKEINSLVWKKEKSKKKEAYTIIESIKEVIAELYGYSMELFDFFKRPRNHKKIRKDILENILTRSLESGNIKLAMLKLDTFQSNLDELGFEGHKIVRQSAINGKALIEQKTKISELESKIGVDNSKRYARIVYELNERVTFND
jgi:hypothetical protein